MNIAALVDESAERFADRAAMDVGGRTYTFAELADLSRRGAAVLAETGRRHVVYLGVGGPGFALALLAAARAGIPFTPVNYRLAAEQIRDLVDRFEDPIVIADDPYKQSVTTPVITSDGFVLAALNQDVVDHKEASADDVAVVLFTSGTTARPKAVLLRHHIWYSYVRRQATTSTAEPSDASLVTVPPYHVMGVAAILNNAYVGRRMVFLPTYSPQGWLDLARAEAVTGGSLVPTMMARLVRHLDGRPGDVPSLRAIAYGGSRTPRSVLEGMLRAFPEVDFVHGYGLTETSAGITALTPAEHREALDSDDPLVAQRLGSAGRAVPGTELQVRDEYDRPAPPGQVGELWVRGPEISGEYAELGSVLDADGWFPTRDRAHLDADGYLYVHGRNDDTIIRGGENIAPAEIEDVLDRHPAVHAVAVVGLPDEEWGERIVAAVVTDPGTSEEELATFVRGQLRRSRTPDEFRFLDDLPLTDTGKVHRRSLVQLLTKPFETGRTDGRPGRA